MKIVLVVATLALFAPAIEAKCITDWHTFSGIVTSMSGTSLANARVEVHWSEMKGKLSNEASAISDASGHFSIRVPFNQISDEGPGGDICNGKLEHVLLHALLSGYERYDETIAVTGHEVTTNPMLKSTVAPPSK